jgi:hypothetical protein
MGWAFFWAFAAVALIMWMTFWITRKAYSKKWDDSGDENQ